MTCSDYHFLYPVFTHQAAQLTLTVIQWTPFPISWPSRLKRALTQPSQATRTPCSQQMAIINKKISWHHIFHSLTHLTALCCNSSTPSEYFIKAHSSPWTFQPPFSPLPQQQPSSPPVLPTSVTLVTMTPVTLTWPQHSFAMENQSHFHMHAKHFERTLPITRQIISSNRQQTPSCWKNLKVKLISGQQKTPHIQQQCATHSSHRHKCNSHEQDANTITRTNHEQGSAPTEKCGQMTNSVPSFLYPLLRQQQGHLHP